MDRPELQRFKQVLASRGLRLTRQREAIAQVFFKADGHLSLPELLELARVRKASVGYATVYRTMKLMADTGLAVEHKFADGSARFEPAGDGHHHDHLICVDCGRIVEYEDHEIERLQDELATRHGFRVVSHRHEIYAECTTPDCPKMKDRNGVGRATGLDISRLPTAG